MISTQLSSLPTGTLVDLSFSMQIAVVIWGCGTSSNPHRSIVEKLCPCPSNSKRVVSSIWSRKWNQHLLCVPMFTAASLTVAKMRKHPQGPPRDERIKKWWCIYTVEYYLALETKENLPFGTTWMDLRSWVKWARHRKKRAAWPHLYVGYKKVESIEAESQRWLSGAGRWVTWGDADRRHKVTAMADK